MLVHHCGLLEISEHLGRNRLQVRVLAASDTYPMFIESTITQVPSEFSGYIWLDTKIVFKKNCSSLVCQTFYIIIIWHPPRGVISTFSWGAKIFFIFQCHRTIEKLEKQHFICSNLMLFIVPFFLSFFFFFFFFSFFFFSFFFSFFFFLGGDGPPSPPQMTPLHPPFCCHWI